MEIVAAQIRSDQCFERKKRNVPLLNETLSKCKLMKMFEGIFYS